MYEQRSIWRNLLLAIGLTPGVVIGGLIVITIAGALDDAITRIQASGHWWILLIMGYILSLICLIYAPKQHRARERKKFVSALILYWETQLAKQNKPKPSRDMLKRMHEELLERVKIWTWFDPDLWSRFYPEEKYPEYPFGIVDGLTAKWEDWRSKAVGDAIGGEAGFKAEFAEYMLSGSKKKN